MSEDNLDQESPNGDQTEGPGSEPTATNELQPTTTTAPIVDELSADQTTPAPLEVDELTLLKSRAETLGIGFHPNIGVDKLKERINETLKQIPKTAVTTQIKPPANTEPVVESAAQRRARLVKEANLLVRCRITCMNPNKREWEGEIYTVSNSVVGSHKKYIPFNASDGYHVPNIIFQHLRERECQVFVTKRDRKGAKVRVGKMIKEFAIEILEPLTMQELDQIRQRQLAQADSDVA